MAVINSIGVGRGEKSVGEFTYRHARGGRTIAARRVIENKSNTPAQAAQRSEFGRIGNVLSGIPKRIMEMLSVKTKYGSARNNFFERNYGGLSVLSDGDAGLSSDFSLAARLNNFATSSMQSSNIYIMPVVGDLQPNFESVSETGAASASISASVRMREGIKKVELGIIAVNAASGGISVSQSLDLQFVVQPGGTYKAENVSGVTVSYNPSTGEASYVIQLNTYVKSVISTTAADEECAVFPCFKVNYRLVNRFQTPSFEYKTT